MICEAVYNTLLGSDRQRLHSSVADILASRVRGNAGRRAGRHRRAPAQGAAVREAIRLRLAASTDTAARGAYVETEGHCAAALALVDEVEDPAERRMLQFRSLIQLGVALSGRHGYSAAAVEDDYRQGARGLRGQRRGRDALSDHARAQTAVNLCGATSRRPYDLSLQVLPARRAVAARRVRHRCDERALLHDALLPPARRSARDWIERCLALYRDEQGHTLSYPVPQDPATAALALLPTVTWLLGDSQACEQAMTDGIDACRAAGARLRPGVPPRLDRRHALSRSGAMPSRCSTPGPRVALGQRHGYREWDGHRRPARASRAGRARAGTRSPSRPRPPPARPSPREGVGLNASWYLWALAGSYIKLGDAQTARGLLAEASRRAAASGETRMNAELLILQAEIETDEASAVRLLDEAVAIADAQGDVATACGRSRSGRCASGEDRPLAREALETLDGRRAYPARPGWMAETAAALRTEELAAAGERPGRSRRR